MNYWLAMLPGEAYIPKRKPKPLTNDQERQKKFRDENREKLREIWRKYRQKNREAINKRRRERYSKAGTE